MSPRAGGEADKFGNRYEGVWTVRQLLYVLSGRIDSITVEEPGEPGVGVEFILRRGDNTEAHQCKRQHGTANGWTLRTLQNVGVLDAARRHVEAGREFHFISVIPARDLDELADRARRSDDLETFVNRMLDGNKIRSDFDFLSSDAVYGSAQTAWETLRGTFARWPDEREVRDGNAALAGLLLEGAESPLLVAVGLGDLIVNNIALRLDKASIERLLGEYGLKRAQLVGSPPLVQAFQTALDTWKQSVGRELLRPSIPRSEAGEIVDRLKGEDRLLFAVGAAGGGKSAVLYEAVRKLEDEGWVTLALRLDRIEPFSSAAELGQRLGLGVPPVTGLAAVAENRPALLVIDQLDAVSLASGRMPATFDAVAEVLRAASAFLNMRVLLACRKFDVDNDHRIRALIEAEHAGKVEIPQLPGEQVDAAVEAMGLAPSELNQSQRELLRSPLNLVLLSSIADQADALSFGTPKDLFDAYWDRKRRDCRQRRQPPVRFGEVIGALANAMSARQRLTVPVSVLDHRDLVDDADVLASEHVLVRDGRRLAFFHEAFFDYAFARRWVGRGQTLVQFLLEGEQELFRRAQVRQILTHLQDEEPERFVSETEPLLLDPNVRYHVKDVVLGLLRALTAPTAAEWSTVERVIASQPPFVEKLWVTLRTLPWFERLDAEGVIQRWLAGDDEHNQSRALEVMIGGAKERPDRMAELLAPHAERAPRFGEWLRWIARFADLYNSRPLFELVLDAVRRGDYDGHERELWLSVHGLGDHQPAWAVELLAAYLRERPAALELDPDGWIAALCSREHSAIRLATLGAEGAPEAFCDLLLPYMRRVMKLTEQDTEKRPILDLHFSHRNPAGDLYELKDALLSGAATALRKVGEEDAEIARPILEGLAADPHDAAQWLLYEGLRAAGEQYAEWAAGLILEGEYRFFTGYLSDSVWTTRQLLQTISPHVSAETFARLEQAILEFRPSWDKRPAARYPFNLLSAMDEKRLSEAGRRRLGEMRRAFEVDQPSEPEGVTFRFVAPPIPQEAAQHMNDEQWLRAIAKHRTDRPERDDSDPFRGGAPEQSQVLRAEAKADPSRFARLAQRLTQEAHPAYGEALLLALGETDQPIDLDLVFDVIRHISTFHHEEHDRWLGWPLRRHLKSDIPDDIFELILDRALHSGDPREDVWSQEAPGGQAYYAGDVLSNGTNTARGSSAEMLGDLLISDADGHRTALVAPSLNQLAEDPSVAVRACVAHLIAACLRHARAEAVEAFRRLLETDDRLLETPHVQNLIVYVGIGEPALIEPVIRRMLASAHEEVRKGGGGLAAYAGLELGLEQLLTSARRSQDVAIREGAAEMCAYRLARTASAETATNTLQQFMNDDEEKVRKVGAKVAAALRGQRLSPFGETLAALIRSPSFTHAASQLFITLERAPDRVDSLILQTAQRFIKVNGANIGNIATGAAADAREIGELVLRAYAQATDAATRATALDMIDELLLYAAFGVDELVAAAER
jgi:hypothetical protein